MAQPIVRKGLRQIEQKRVEGEEPVRFSSFKQIGSSKSGESSRIKIYRDSDDIKIICPPSVVFRSSGQMRHIDLLLFDTVFTTELIN